jgi:hypothetical protein
MIAAPLSLISKWDGNSPAVGLTNKNRFINKESGEVDLFDDDILFDKGVWMRSEDTCSG